MPASDKGIREVLSPEVVDNALRIADFELGVFERTVTDLERRRYMLKPSRPIFTQESEMPMETMTQKGQADDVQYFDVIIVGAGISGIAQRPPAQEGLPRIILRSS